MRKSLLAAVLSTAVAGASCTVHQQSVPSVSGPSGVAFSVQLSATPDSVVQDGSQTARISVQAFDPTGHPTSQQVQLSLQGPGALSATSVQTQTDTSKPAASVTYAPPATTTGNAQVVTVFGSIVGSTGAASATGPLASPQVSLTIRPALGLVSTAPVALMNVPSSANVQQAVTFDGSASCGTQLVSGFCTGNIPIASATWNFGDNSSASGSVVSHAYAANGTYTVTLTVTNAVGALAMTSQTITVATVGLPTAAYTVSPSSIPTNACNPFNAFFNAAASKAAAGHLLITYDWDFGDGTRVTTTTSSTAHCYSLANTYHTTLTVTDDIGQQSTIGQDVTAK